MNRVRRKDKIYQVAIIGAGKISAMFDRVDDKQILTHAHAIVSIDRFKLIGFFDNSKVRAREAANKWGGKVYNSLAGAIENADIVCCCVPDKFHYDVLEEIGELFKGKLVITEKPLVTSIDEALRIKELYNTKKISVAVNYSRRYLPIFQQIKKCYMNGLYGKYLKGVGYYGKGVLHNGSHMIDILSFILNECLNVESVSNSLIDFSENDRSCDIRLSISGGVFNMFCIDSNVATIFEMDLFFEKKRIRVLCGGERVEFYDVKESPIYEEYYNYVLSKTMEIDYSDAMLGLYNNALEYMDGKASLICNLYDASRVIKICEKVKGLINV